MGGRGSNISTGGGRLGNGDVLGEWNQTLKDAIGNKGKAISQTKALRDANPNHDAAVKVGSAEWLRNCQRCVVAYELQRRGYGVEAMPTYRGDRLPQVAYTDKNGTQWGRWMGAFQGAKPVSVGVAGNNKAAEKDVISNINAQLKAAGDGARGVVQIMYRRGGGHVFNVEYTGGRVRYFEAQTGNVKSITNTMSKVNTGSVVFVRTDNLRISSRAKDFVMLKKNRSEEDRPRDKGRKAR